ncbi:MAG: YceI family protein [Solirubrobacteraceae bacterium MAG38_C4-C5]|nr:YceI family protein [Candidatus Siliceabacter maunaloa]
MSLNPGTHKVGPSNGSLQVHTFREGMAQKVGHDLIIEVEKWEATVEVGQDGAPAAITLDADPESLRVREGVHGLKPLSDKDLKDIHEGIDDKVLRKQPITFRSSSVAQADGRLTVGGELTMVGTSRPADFEVGLGDDGRVTGKLNVVQSEWGIKPYKALMGALKVRDDVEIFLDVSLPAD